MITLLRGDFAVAMKQWQVNFTLLQRTGPALRRLRIGLLVDAETEVPGTSARVNQLPWKALGEMMTRFPHLEEIGIFVEGEGERESEIWQEVERALCLSISSRVRIVQCRDYIT